MRASSLVLVCMLLTACAAQVTAERTEEVGLRAIAAGLQCGKGEGAAVIELAAGDASDAGYSASESERVFMISMGPRPTAGYSLGLARTRARLERGVVGIPVVWREPARGAITAQLMTRPCLVVALEKRRYAGVRVLDQNGIERARLALNE